MTEYQEFISEVGRPLASINPGSKEFALSLEDSKKAIAIMKKDELPILGGDVMTEKNGELTYAYQSWGMKYHSLDWYTNKNSGESIEEYTQRSYQKALDSIMEAEEVSNKLKETCLIVLVVDEGRSSTSR